MAKSKLLTDTQYAALKAKESEYRISDIAGLYLKVGIAGKKSWQLRLKNTAGKWTWLGLGSYPTISVKEARSLAIKYQNGELNLKTKNEKILEAKQQENLLFGNLLIKWMNTKRGVWTEQTFKKEYQSIEKHILPVFGDRLFKDIPASEWKEFFREKQLNEQIFNRLEKLISYCRNAYDFAIDDNLITYNPLARVKKGLLNHTPEAMKHVEMDELPDLVNAIRGYRSESISIGLELLVMLFPRPGELRAARWDQFNFETKMWLRPADVMKRRIPHAIPLPAQAIQLLYRLKEISRNGNEYLFPSRSGSKEKFISEVTFNRALNRVGYNGKQNPHGFRHIASTYLNDIFSDKEQVIESALSHQKTGVKGAYDKGAHLRERVGVMQYWADHLDSICGVRLLK
ncbi:tyrosine-type recombinase/integrase [Acinetobacter indicus]|uniref:tyrosine-type recombinase/integrase n=2 Tax=Acinetobacter TaxID=469 RepID=UPI000CEB6ED0|nr:tyrosine-type recombinase/integrase [Acinetobacter indicus]AVH14352.1 DUF4102 domain-containing protein [Acinetobacter indicus]